MLVGVRPEKVRLHVERPERAGNDVRATIADVSFTGVATQYLVTVPSGGQWSVYEQNLDVAPRWARPGDEVWLSWDPSHAFTVAAQGRPPGSEDKAFIATAGSGT